MSSEIEAPEEVRCFCSRKPLLARVGREDGRPFVHVRNLRARFEMVFIEGIVRIKCRECHRWHRIKIGKLVEVEAER